jgi:PKD repeat protein
MKKSYILFLGLIFSLGFIQTTQAQIVNIPDASFKSLLVGDFSINTNMDAEIQVTEAESYQGSIIAYAMGITDLTGIEEFDSITYLDVNSNGIGTINLSNNTQLTYLDCSNNVILNMNTNNNMLLTTLKCGFNDMLTLNFDSCYQLTLVDVQSNMLSSLNVAQCSGLITLNCQDNDLTSLDLGNNFSLQTLNCQYNQLTGIDLSSNWALGWIDISDNLISCLDLNANFMLNNAYAMNNPMLAKVNFKNYYNTNILGLNFQNCPLLVCFQVDDTTYSNSFWSSEIDPGAYFSLDCGQPIALFDNSPVGCLATPITFDQTLTNADSFIWYFGDGDTTTVVNDPVHTYPYGNLFYVQLFAKNCYGSSMADTDIVIGHNIFGNIDYSLGPLADGDMILLKYQPFYTSFDTIQIINGFETAGFYSFEFITEGFYQIKVFPDTTVNPLIVPTYSGNTSNWESAFTINHGCLTSDSLDITMLEITAGTAGPGALSGEIIEGAGFGRAQGDPIHGVDVKLGITASTTIVDCTTTDTLGQYSFTNLPVGNYTIYAEIPGLLKDSSYQIIIDSTNMIWTYLDYQVDSNSIDIVGNIGIETIQDDQIGSLGVYPNPVKDQTNILYSLKEKAHVVIDVYNMYGVKVQSIVNTDSELGEHLVAFNPKLANLKSGIYFITLTANGKSRTVRIVIME